MICLDAAALGRVDAASGPGRDPIVEGVMDAHYRFDGSIDYNGFWTDRHHPVFVRPTEIAPPRLASPVRRRVRVFACAFALATAAFWATMATMPPTSEAGPASVATAGARDSAR
jgi:hypothetical protein